MEKRIGVWGLGLGVDVHLEGPADEEEERGDGAYGVVFGGEGDGEAGHSHEEHGPHERCGARPPPPRPRRPRRPPPPELGVNRAQ
jgi:hypothetical protein